MALSDYAYLWLSFLKGVVVTLILIWIFNIASLLGKSDLIFKEVFIPSDIGLDIYLKNSEISLGDVPEEAQKKIIWSNEEKNKTDIAIAFLPGFSTTNFQQKEFFDRHFLIFSGLFGSVSPMTLIPNYKLKMNVLQLYKFWNPTLTEELKKENLVVDLLPQIHKKAYTQSENCINIDFSVVKDGKKVAAGHNGKMVKGQFIQFVCRNMITKFEDMIKFEFDGFKWDGKIFLKEK